MRSGTWRPTQPICAIKFKSLRSHAQFNLHAAYVTAMIALQPHLLRQQFATAIVQGTVTIWLPRPA